MTEKSREGRRSAWRWASVALTVLLIAAGALYAIRHAGEFAPLTRLSLLRLVYIALLAFLSLVLLGWCNKLVVGVFGADLGFGEWFGLTMVGTMANMFAPFAPGAGMRALYLKRVRGLAFVHFASCLAAPLLVGALVNSSLGLAALIVLKLQKGVASVGLFSAVLAVFAASLTLALWPLQLATPEGKWLRRLVLAVQGWRALVTERRAMGKLGAAMAGRALILTGIYKIILDGLGQPAPLLACLTMASLGSITRLINITPGALGLYEGVLMLVSASLGGSASAGMMAALVHRLVSSLLILASGIAFGHVLARGIAGVSQEEEEAHVACNDQLPS